MATGISGRSFLAIVKRSGVVSEEELNRALADLQKRADLAWDDPAAVAKAMVEQGVLTQWQADKMLLGKHKGFTLGQYRLLDILGRGGMGAVYLAEHTLMRRRCAIKVLPAKNLGSRSYYDRFIREAQAVAALDHPNIVKAYDLNQDKVGDAPIHFLAMEYVEGRDLQRIVDEGGPLSYSEAAEYIRQAAEGLAHGHEAGMVHRDIKPANLLVNVKSNSKNAKGVVKILDFGLAKFYDNQQEASLTVAHNETVLGTADYLSPEQAVDSHNTDHRADIYSLGCTFYFLLTGHPPFCEGSVANRLLNHQIKPPPPIRDARPDAPESLLVIIDRMMAKKRDERYQSARDVAEDLLLWLAENGNAEWKEQNTELVRKVQESWRADTKVVSGALVDTAELDLKADEDLGLAPLDAGGETPKESPLVSGASAAGAASVHDSHLDLNLAPHDSVATTAPPPRTAPPAGKSSTISAKSPAGAKPSGIAAPAKPVQPAVTPVELPPLAAPDLAPLEPLSDLQSLDVSAAAAPNLSVDSSNVLSSGLRPALTPAQIHAAAPTPQPAKGEGNGLPMWLIIGIVAIGVLVVLGLIVMIVTNSGKRDQATASLPGASATAPSPAANAPPVAPPAEVRSPTEGAARPSDQNNAGRSEASQSSPPPPVERSPHPSPEAPPPSPTASAVESPSETPAEATSTAPPQPAEASPAAPASQGNIVRQTQEKSPPAEAPPAVKATRAASPLSDEEKQRLLAAVTKVAIKEEISVPNSASAVRDAIMYEAGEKLRAAGIEPSDSADATLLIRAALTVDQPRDGQKATADANVRFDLNVELSVSTAEGPTPVWSDSLVKSLPARSFAGGRPPAELRREIGTLFRRLSIDKKKSPTP